MTRPVLIVAAFAAFVAGVVPGQSADLFAVPQGCTAYVTAQHRNCQVSQHYRCAGDAAGEQWSVYLDGAGAHFASKTDSETRWLESINLISGDKDRIGTETDPAAFSVLLRSGRDDFDFTTTDSAGETTRFRGFDQLTGETVTIDGVTLERTRFELTAEAGDGSFLWSRRGRQLISRDWRLFLSDMEDFENSAGDKVSSTDTPMEFSFPGDKGFLSTKPKFDCGVVTARLAADQAGMPPEGRITQ